MAISKNVITMKRLLLLLILCSFTLSITAQKNAPKWLDKQRKAIVSVSTYANDGSLLNKGTGFFISETGEALSGYLLFKGAAKAVVTDTDGKEYPVVSILGADELYDVIKFKVTVPKKTPYLSVASDPLPNGGKAYAVPYSAGKTGLSQAGIITEVSKLKDTYSYYKTTIPFASEQYLNAPVFNESGQVFGLMQEDAAGKKEVSYAVSAGYVNNLSISSVDMLNNTYTQIGIDKAWPSDADQANIALYLLSSSQPPLKYIETLNNFIATFPTSPYGYSNRASFYARNRILLSPQMDAQAALNKAAEDLVMEEKYTQDKSEALYNKAQLQFDVALNDTTLSDTFWTLPAAMNTIQQAIASADKSYYRMLEGDIYFTQGAYESAYDSYMKVNASPEASPTSYHRAAQALDAIPGTPIVDIIALLDQAIEKAGTAINNDILAYLLERIDYKLQLMQYDEAIADYNLYAEWLDGQVGDNFYYLREQAKFKAGDFSGALVDIQQALRIDRNNPNYLAEEASVYIRLENHADALKSIDSALAIAPDFASCYRLKGICQVRQNKNKEACDSFAKARELGDPYVNRLIREHCK